MSVALVTSGNMDDELSDVKYHETISAEGTVMTNIDYIDIASVDYSFNEAANTIALTMNFQSTPIFNNSFVYFISIQVSNVTTTNENKTYQASVSFLWQTTITAVNTITISVYETDQTGTDLTYNNSYVSTDATGDGYAELSGNSLSWNFDLSVDTNVFNELMTGTFGVIVVAGYAAQIINITTGEQYKDEVSGSKTVDPTEVLDDIPYPSVFYFFISMAIMIKINGTKKNKRL